MVLLLLDLQIGVVNAKERRLSEGNWFDDPSIVCPWRRRVHLRLAMRWYTVSI